MSAKLFAIERDRTKQFFAYKAIVEEIAADEEPIPWNPEAAEMSCKYCSAQVTHGYENHEQDCVYIRSKDLVKESA